VEKEEEAIARQLRGKHVSASTNQHATIEELLEAMYSSWSAPRLHSENQRRKLVSQRSKSAVKTCFSSEQWQFVAGCEETPMLAADTEQRLVTTE
jgi:hypothetical protein